MPYKSQAQAAYFNIHKDEMEAQGVNVDEWNTASKGMKLPARAPSRAQHLARHLMRNDGKRK